VLDSEELGIAPSLQLAFVAWDPAIPTAIPVEYGAPVSMSPKVALVTGASTGIGEATAKRLAREPGIELVLVARREELLRELADSLPCRATHLAVDLTSADAPERVRAHVEANHDGLDLLVNNAGGAWRGSFAESGYANVHRHMELNFDAVVRLTEALLPLLRSSAPSSIVNVASTAGRVSRARTGAYSASKFALIGWTDALYAEELPHGVHVGMVLPGFVATEGFPATELRQKALTRWIVSKPEKIAAAIYEVGPGGKAERYAPRPYALAAIARILAPRLVRRVLSGGAAANLTTSTAAERSSGTAD
jgi:uncharacterized protein